MQKTIIYNYFTKQRIDIYLKSIYKCISRTYFQQLIHKQKILLNGYCTTANHKLHYGDNITVVFESKKNETINPFRCNINVLYEDDDLIIIDKQPGIVVHPSNEHISDTMINALVSYANGKFQPYVVHRLDKNTSGAIIFAKNQKSQIKMIYQFKKRLVKKIYYAAVQGLINEDNGIIKAPLGRNPKNRKMMSVGFFANKQAVTKFQVIKRFHNFTFIKIQLCTGRTHQIRSHMKYIHHPIIGDSQYGGIQEIG
ncbi:MAG: RluA family pseudouridine synthase, partial [Endomicrobium sp.]|nr:RluA family pseudouridine synthase [Endomicrobium sp.]